MYLKRSLIVGVLALFTPFYGLAQSDQAELTSTTKIAALADSSSLSEETKIEKRIIETAKAAVQSPLSPIEYAPIRSSAGGDAKRVGNPDSDKMLKQMYDEIANGMGQRGVSERYAKWRAYANSTLNNSRAKNTGSELDGRSRLNWYDKLFREGITSVFDMEPFSRQIHVGLLGDAQDLAVTLTKMREKLDVPTRSDSGVRFAEIKEGRQALQEIRRCITESQSNYSRSLSTLTNAELTDLATNLYPILTNGSNGHTLPQRGVAKRLITLIEKTDRKAMHNAIEALAPISDKQLLDSLKTLNTEAYPSVTIGGQNLKRIATPAGDILIGGKENNVYNLDLPEYGSVVCVIDLGGNDTYLEGTSNVRRPILVTIDLDGNDTYRATKPGVQGSSILGISMLLDLKGDDTYIAQDLAQGSTLGGGGILIDYAGNDSYLGLRRAQGCALGGVGLLIDKAGDDKYRAALWAQGLGHPGGFGVLEDAAGNDSYYVGGLYLDSYPEHPGYDGWGQGVGAGIRQVANGGFGMLLEGDGDDSYEFDYFSHGGGYWLGAGIARDFGGNDKRHGATLTAYNGGPRSEKRWQRFSNGFGCHYALGFCIDDDGDDSYDGTIMGLGMGWDLSLGFLLDFNGKDSYLASGGLTQGIGAEGSIGILLNYFGDDTYQSRGQGTASSGITYHSASNCGANFSFAIDYGGTDKYASGSKNNSYNTRGSSSGFLIDRPLESEYAAETVAIAKAAKEAAEKPLPLPPTVKGRPQPVQRPAARAVVPQMRLNPVAELK